MGEITTIYDSMLPGEANTFAVVRAFVRHRNAALQPKPVDPAIEVVSKMLRDRSLDTSLDDYAALLVNAVLMRLIFINRCNLGHCRKIKKPRSVFMRSDGGIENEVPR